MSFAGWAELICVFILAFLIIGPKDFPRILFMIGRLAKNLQAMAVKFMDELENLQNETDQKEVKKIDTREKGKLSRSLD